MKKIITLYIIIILVLSGCGLSEENTEASAGGSGIEKILFESETSEYNCPVISGISLNDYPAIDGPESLQPLITAVYKTICDTDADTAGALSDYSEGGNALAWRSFWEKTTTDSDGEDDGGSDAAQMLIAYEPPESIKEEFYAWKDSFEKDPVGLTGLVFFTTAINPVSDLTIEQIKDIFSGEITNWNQVGGIDEPILPMLRNEDAASSLILKNKVLGSASPAATQLVFSDAPSVIRSVQAAYRDGCPIGFALYDKIDEIKAEDVKIISINGILPDDETIKSEEYPITDVFSVIIQKSIPQGDPVRLLRDWLLSDAGKDLIKNAGYIPA